MRRFLSSRPIAATLLLPLFFVLLAPLSAHATGLKFGSICKDNIDCISNDCESSSQKDANGETIRYCDCAIADDCTLEFGRPSDNGEWVCKDGANNLYDLDYCISTKKQDKHFPVPPADTGALNSLVDAVLDSDVTKAQLFSEVHNMQPKLEIRIPGLNFSAAVRSTTDPDGKTYVYLPWIGQYIAALYKLAIVVISIIGVAMMVRQGFNIVFGGEFKEGALKRIPEVIAGLMLVWLSYALLYYINPDLVSFKILKVQYIQRQELPEEDDNIDPSQYPELPAIDKPTWDYKTFDCSKRTSYPPAGIAPGDSVITYTCDGIQGRITTVPEMKDPLCKVGKLALADGFTLQVNSDGGSYRTFKSQVDGWCGPSAAQYPDPLKRKSYRAVPGFSNHGHGRAIDVFLAKNGKQLFGADSKAQCSVPLELIQKLANYFYTADKANFVRLEREIWHFEYGTGAQAFRGQYTGKPEACR